MIFRLIFLCVYFLDYIMYFVQGGVPYGTGGPPQAGRRSRGKIVFAVRLQSDDDGPCGQNRECGQGNDLYLFKNKEELFDEILRSVIVDMRRIVEREVDENKPFLIICTG